MNDYISNYQKIVFSNGLSENDLTYSSQTGFEAIKSLSHAYPFVIFITEGFDQSISSSNNIKNIWINGTRLNRFIGIDQNQNTIRVGDHILKLRFDYSTGLIGIYDENMLNSIKLVEVSCIKPEDDNVAGYSIRGEISSFEIFSKKNEFNLVFRYELDNSQNSGNISNVSKSILYNIFPDTYSYAFEINSLSKLGASYYKPSESIDKVAYYLHKCTIKEPAIINSLTFTSEYSNNAVDTINNGVKLYLNPIDYIISYSINGSDGNIPVTNQINVTNNTTYTVTLKFEPDNVHSTYLYNLTHQIAVEMSYSSNGAYFIYENNSNTPVSSTKIITKELSNSQITFSFKVNNKDIDTNQSLENKINFKVKYKLSNEENESFKYYDYLNKSLSLILSGKTSNKFFYFGYEDPTINHSLLKDYSHVEIGNYIWKDAEINNNESDSYYTDKYFYCAIPIIYSNYVKPRWRAWLINNINEYNTNKYNNPLDCLDWFDTIYTFYTINGIDFIIYKRKLLGKFEGHIK